MVSLILAMAVLSSPWTIPQAEEWGMKQPWRAGCNFIPSNAINQLEMWQAGSFDPKLIEHEFALMQGVGMTAARIYLHDLAYEADPKGFKNRMRTVLQLADRHGVRVLFVFFDDCWNADPKVGKQPAPRPGVHNSGWVQSPGGEQRRPQDFPRLKTYVQDVLKTFSKDRRVWMWDLYNEPGNSGYGDGSLPLLKAVFDWAREVRPSQPLTVAPWLGGGDGLDRVSIELSDVVTFHCYSDVDTLRKQIAFYKSFKRPVICTEWMARTNDSLIVTHLPVFKSEGVSCLQWGFVSGKTNTIYPWGSAEGSPEPKPWFHDLLRKDGTPFDPAEVELYRRLCRGIS